MKLSTRSRYGIRLLFELALDYGNNNFLFLKDISEKQQISEKYLSSIIIPLKNSKLVISSRGAHGGYMLARDPESITIKEVIDILEGTPLTIECIENTDFCKRAHFCPSQKLWEELENVIVTFLKSKTIKDLINNYNLLQNKNTNMYYI